MNPLAPPFNLADAELTTARGLVEHLRQVLSKAERALERLEGPQPAPRQPASTPASSHPTCAYCTGRHPNFAGIGGCPHKAPCSICGGDHKAGKRGANHARVMRARRATTSTSTPASTSSPSPPTSSSVPPGNSSDQGGCSQSERSVEAQESERTGPECPQVGPDMPEQSAFTSELGSDLPSVSGAIPAEERSAQGKERTGQVRRVNSI